MGHDKETMTSLDMCLEFSFPTVGKLAFGAEIPRIIFLGSQVEEG